MRVEQFEEQTSHTAWLLCETAQGTERMQIEYTGKCIDIRISLTGGVQAVHFQPAPEHGCLLYNLRLLSDCGMLCTKNLDGVRLGLFDICPIPGALLRADVESGPSWIQILAEISVYGDAMSYELFGLVSDRIRNENTHADLLRELQEERENLLAEVNSLRSRMQKWQRSSDAESRAIKKEKERLERLYKEVAHSTSWKITKPIRVITDMLKKIMRTVPGLRLFYKGLISLRREGFKSTLNKVRGRSSHRQTMLDYIENHSMSESDLEAQRKTQFGKRIKFSILVPLYNTPKKFLIEMIRSVQKQSYQNWELCLADGSDEQNRWVESICRTFMKKDSRILYQRLDGNQGISGNSNQCIEMASGDYLGLFDHDDLLHPSLLFEIMQVVQQDAADFIYTDEMTFSGTIKKPITLHFKSDFAIDSLRSNNYICHFSCFRRDLLDKVGGFRSECDGSQDYDLILRLTEQAEKIVHIPKILYYWRSHPGSVASDLSVKPYCVAAAIRALTDHLNRLGLAGTVEESPWVPTTYRIEYALKGMPLISILIPNKDHITDLRRCIHSIQELSTYSNWEIVICENNSVQDSTFAFYHELKQDPRIRIIKWEGDFNFSAINNYMAENAQGEYLLLLNNDTQVITPQWLEEMLMYAQREDVGAVGVKLYYPDDTIQHAGVVVGLGGVAGHVHLRLNRNDVGYMGRLAITQNFSAVTAACLMVSREDFFAVGGLDLNLAVAYNDVDLCLKLRERGKLNIFTPYAELYHYESLSRGLDDKIDENFRFYREKALFQQKWKQVLHDGDPYFNPNFRLDHSHFWIDPAKK